MKYSFFSKPRGNYKNLSLFEIKQFSKISELTKNEKYILLSEKFDFNRLSLSNFICELIYFGEREKLIEHTKKYFREKFFPNYRISGNVKYFNVFRNIINGHVNLTSPKTEFYINEINENKIIFGKIIWKRNNSIFKKHFMKSYFRSDNLKPTCARFLVNLSLVKPGETLLDPFCGTGSILIEGAYLGAKCYGIEIDENIYEGCLDNLFVLRYDDKCTVYNQDALKFKYDKYDVLVTDLPYGKSSSLKKKTHKEIIEYLPKIFKHIRKRKVVMFNDDISHIWDLIEMEKYKVHGNLTRYIHIFK